MFPTAAERGASRERVGFGWRAMVRAGLALGCELRDAIGVSILHRRTFAPIVLADGLLPTVVGKDGRVRSATFTDDGTVGTAATIDVLEHATDALGAELHSAGLTPHLELPAGVDPRHLRLLTLAEWFAGWTPRYVAALDGADGAWADGIRRFDAAGIREAIGAGVLRSGEWRAAINAALRSVGQPHATDALVAATVRDVLARGGSIPTCRGYGGRLVPDFRGLRDSGVLGKRRRSSRAKPRPAGSSESTDVSGLEASESRTVARLAILEEIERAERNGKIRAHEAEMMKFSATLDYDGFGGRSHCRALNAAGFRISQPGLLKMARRVRKALRAG